MGKTLVIRGADFSANSILPVATQKEWAKNLSNVKSLANGTGSGVFINDIYLPNGCQMEIKIKGTGNAKVSGSTFSVYQTSYGGSTPAVDTTFGMRSQSRSGSSSTYRFYCGGAYLQIGSAPIAEDIEYIIKASVSSITVNSSSSSYQGTITSDALNNVTVGFVAMGFWATQNSGDSVDFPQLGYAKILSSTDELLHEFVPAIDTANRPCIWDKVTDNLYYANDDSYISCYDD